MLIFLSVQQSIAQRITESYLQNKSVTYQQAIDFYTQLASQYPTAKLLSCGNTDSGKPLHLFVISSDKDFDAISNHKKNKTVLLINNGIHPGEPDGIDASLKLAEDLLSKPENAKMLEHVVICIIPVYNIDGALMRGCCQRANQNGPEESGFRGNYQNLDLNRDFIKCDAENTKSFVKIFREWSPDVFVDTHVSDGADYQYVMTLITTQHNKLGGVLGDYQHNTMTPQLYKMMKEKKSEMCPYVETIDETPDSGITEFLETPRFASGYAALFHTLSFISETHMLKPFKDRVDATYNFLSCVVDYCNTNHSTIIEKKNQQKKNCAAQKTFSLKWELDTTKFSFIDFKGYEGKHKTSSVSGLPRLYYDRSSPYQKKIKFYNEYYSSLSIEKPVQYIIPQAWKRVINLLKLNKVEMKILPLDTFLTGEMYYIEKYETSEKPYEGHYLHHDITVRKETQLVQFFKGDYVIDVNQTANRYIVETLEPQSGDSYFAWGFFDAILQQKEWFSSYVFEERAEEILKEDEKLKAVFEQKKKSDANFAKDSFEQLRFIYTHSKYFEKSFMRHPVMRVMK